MKLLMLCLILFATSVAAQSGDGAESKDTFRMPAEWEPHRRTYMVWPQSEEIWPAKYLHGVRGDIADIANAIVDFEPVVMLVDPTQVSMARPMLDERVKIVKMPVDDLWARDTLPVFVVKTSNGNESVVGVNFNFNGWGNKQIHENDGLLAGRVLEMLKMESRKSAIVSEGGSLETDGKGTLLATKSSIVNTNRNAQSIEEIEKELKNLLGVKKIIWFEGVKGEDITDAHVDCLVRFVKPGVVVLNRQFPGEPEDSWSKSSNEAALVLKNATDAAGNPFKVIDLVEPDPKKVSYEGDAESYVASYTNFLIGNRFVLIPAFGDEEADLKAKSTLQEIFPERNVVSVPIESLAVGGGGIHCATHDVPKIQSM